MILRLLVAAAAAAAVTGTVLMRSRDHSAGRQVAELTRARAADQWKTEERIAELESDLEESRELRARLDAKLRSKRVELAGLRSEHADLLRRYATAETERASALEGRRVLALESGTAAAKTPAALPPATSTAGSAPTPEAYRRAAEALLALEARAARAHAPEPAAEPAQPAEDAQPDQSAQPVQSAESAESAESVEDTAETADDAQAEPEAEVQAEAVTGPATPEADPHTQPSAPSALRTVPAAASIVPYAARRPVPRPSGGFDYFGTQVAAGAKKAAAIEAALDTDLADVVGDEVLADATERPTAEQPAIGQVIDLTAHDETEQLDLTELRGAVNS
ncbi:hypothetical protein SLA_3314 [Streptomyces laurentii]|uniref:Secreted protein n=1 Tax=Streptomyces laurentii TaxID=39478 RepID=A0A160P0X1_STRLU|nr:hypothetical protein SLA_3314 [Streptomyces laurentii]